MSAVANPQQRQFNPYAENGGTILAVAGADFTVIAGDTRQSEGYSIQTRYAPKVFRLTDRAVLAVNGFAADGNMFVKKVKQRLEWYRHAHAKDMPLRAIARLIQTMLYARRFFPFYVYNILGGIEEDGSGAVYSFDPVGSYERETCRAAGAAQSLVQPFLDNQPYTTRLAPPFRLSDLSPNIVRFLANSVCLDKIYFKNQTPAQGSPHPAHLPLPDVLSIVIDSFTSATERHIEVGDGLEMYIVLAKGRTLPDAVANLRPQELASAADGERVFVLKRDLKKD
ncbi:proteasome subunit [Lactarius quietus]|nr:proteasome subunit [Lactarius quietus]